MQDWLDAVGRVQALQDVSLDPSLVAAMVTDAKPMTPLRLYTPPFRPAASSELPSCSQNTWPAISITGRHCDLGCDHCKGKVLNSMIPATDPDTLWQVAQDLVAQGAKGLLISGGSDRRNRIAYSPFMPVLERIKATFPDLQLAAHTALIDRAGAQALEQAGVDIAMMDLIGAQDTISQVYHLRRRVADFEATLDHLLATRMRVVPHIVLGLHYGHLLGEWHALDILAKAPPDALVLAIAMPYYAPHARPFAIPDSHALGQFFYEARLLLRDCPITLGCARPNDAMRQPIDCYAVLAGLDGLGQPAEGIAELAQQLGRLPHYSSTCCAVQAEAVASEAVPRDASAAAPWAWSGASAVAADSLVT